MAFKKIPLTIDTMIRNPVPIEGINQEDNIELNIVVTENKTPKDLSSQTIKVYVRRVDGTLVEQTDQITPTNASKGEVTVKLKNSAFNKEGYALFQLDISDSSGRITSSYATFKIGKGLVSGEAIANTNEIEALKKVEEYIKKANQELEIFKQTVAEINENEATRQENEVVRVNEEASRNEAEAIRAQQEATRKEKESERVQAEIKRIADEEVRRENEVLRESKELERKQAEELRKETELLRIEDENNRKVVESKRIEAESVRVEAEKLRVAAETGRVGAENLRVTAEEERVAAETKREEGFNAFEGRISANTKELKNARSATTGEKFDTLDERIDCEVDRLNKKIEVAMLQQEDKENHVIENSIEGMTTDMIVKGRTLQNLWDIETTDGFYMANLDNGYYVENSKNFACLPNTKYTLIYNEKNQTDNYASVLYKDVNGIHISEGANCRNGQMVTFTTPSNCYYLYTRGFRNAKPHTVTNNGFNFIIIKGELKESVNYFEGVKSFGQQEDKISILSHGENLLDIKNITNGGSDINTTVQNDKVIITSLDNSRNWMSSYIVCYLKANTDYSFKYNAIGNGFIRANIRDFYDDSIIYTNDIAPDYFRTFRVSKDVKVRIRFYITGSTGGSFKNEYYNIQLKEGSQDTLYKPYQQDKKDILLQDLGFDEGLRGLNNTVYDELNSIRDVAVKRVEKKVLNGDNEGWGVWTNSTGDVINAYVYFNDVIPSLKGRVKPDSICLNDRLPSNQGGHLSITEGFKITSTYFTLSIHKSKLGVENVNDPNNTTALKNWLKQNPITVYYELAEPVETPLIDPVNVKTFNEKTYVSFENAISGTSNFKVPVDTTATITRLNRENRALEEENKNLRQDFESTTLVLTDSDLELVKQNVDMDFRLMEVEFALDIPQAILSSNFKNKKGEVKSMARTPYEMMKIVILSGDYDREDYMHKVGKYYERGRMTKEEYDELMSLMTADEVIGE